MAEETAPTIALEHVNVPPMQTWNYLHANDTSLTVPVPKSTGAVLGRLPKLFNRLDCAIGKDAETWASNSSDESRYVEGRGPRHGHHISRRIERDRRDLLTRDERLC